MGRIAAGSLNQRIALVASGPAVSDGRGGQLPGDAPDTRETVWARVRVLRGAEKVLLGQTLNDSLAEATIRQRAGVNTDLRVEWRGRTFNVVAVVPDEYNEYYLLTCLDAGQ